MKILITENKLNDFILKYIEEKYPVDRINYNENYDDDGNPVYTSYVFYFADDADYAIFRWYDKDYWEGDNKEILQDRIEKSPMLYFEDSREIAKLDKMFGKYWRPMFKKWFYDNFEMEIKTIW